LRNRGLGCQVSDIQSKFIDDLLQGAVLSKFAQAIGGF
jgi:hypothetical protein